MKSIVILLLLNSLVLAQEEPLSELGKIIKVQGEASLLLANNKIPKIAERGDQVLDDSSIYCKQDCYLTIKFKNEISYLKLGNLSSINLRAINDHIHIKLHTGFLKILFKANTKINKIIVETKNAWVDIDNGKTLVIYNPLFDKTSLINLKGSVLLSTKDRNQSLKLNVLEYSNIQANKIEPVEKLAENRLNSLLNAFQINPKKLD